MIKKMSVRKIIVSSIALLLSLLLYFFPTKEELKLDPTINYYSIENLQSVYLMDKYNYVSKLKLSIEQNKTEDIIKERIDYLIIGSEKSDKIPNGFRQIIPSDTKILNVEVNNDIVLINFSKEILNVNREDEERMIEAIVYTLTELDNIDNIIIQVEGENLVKLPNSHKIIGSPLNRDFGINKIYDIDNLNDLTKTTIYYVNEINDSTYYIPVTKINNDNRDKVTVIIDELKSSIIYQSNLSSYLNANAELDKYEIVDDKMILSFNDKILDGDNNSILEEVEYTISMSIMDNFDVKKVVFSVNNQTINPTSNKTLE